MSRKEHHTRSFEKIFEQATSVGAENVILNDSEVGIIQAGGGPPLSAGTIQNRRWKGIFNAPYQHGVRGSVEYRLSDVLAERDHRLRKQA